MDKEYWQARWQTPDIKFNQNKPNAFLLQYIPALNLSPNATVFVPLCGKSIDMVWLAAQGYRIVGVEFSPQACQMFYQENKLPFQTEETERFTVFKGDKITLYCGDFFDLTPAMLGKIAAIYDRAALVALPSDLRTKYARHLLNLSPLKIQILLITLSYEPTQMPGPPFSVDEQEVKTLYDKPCHIQTLYNAPAQEIAPHLQAKGLKQAQEQVFLITKNSAFNP